MMTARDIASAEQTSQTLAREGRLDPEWVAAFLELPIADHADPRTWSPGFFQLRHFVSAYLPLRYWSWARATGRRDEETERQIASLTLHVAEGLWVGLTEAAETGPATVAPELVDLVLLSGNPLHLGPTERAAWNETYVAAIEGLSPKWNAMRCLPRWEAMSMHVASFYLPVGLPDSTLAIEALPHQSWLTALAPHLHPDVWSLVRAWVALARAERDRSGVPVAKWVAPGALQLAGRTRTESLLLRGGTRSSKS